MVEQSVLITEQEEKKIDNMSSQEAQEYLTKRIQELIDIGFPDSEFYIAKEIIGEIL